MNYEKQIRQIRLDGDGTFCPAVGTDYLPDAVLLPGTKD